MNTDIAQDEIKMASIAGGIYRRVAYSVEGCCWYYMEGDCAGERISKTFDDETEAEKYYNAEVEKALIQ